MKKLFTFIAVICFALNASAQYQVKNSNFEEWETISGTNEEPKYWNSFLTASGSMLSFIKYNQLVSSTDVRPGTLGSKSAKINDRKVLLSNYAQGNLTTGCINGGSMTADDASGNFNYTNESTGQCMIFKGRPDAVSVWIKNSTSAGQSKGKIAVYLHEKGYYQDPYYDYTKNGKTIPTQTGVGSGQGTSAYAKLVASAEASPSSNTSWRQEIIPFTYESGVDRPYYALVSFATNSIPGKGTGNDYMYIDDMEMVYYHSLASVVYDGTNVTVASAMDLSNQIYDENKLSLTHNAKGNAQISKSYDPATGLLTITVYGEDYGTDTETMFQNPNSFTTYTIQFKTYEKGDVNKDGSVTIADVTALVNIILGKGGDDDMANVNGDEGITIADVTALVNIILGKN